MSTSSYDDSLVAAVRHFQRRHGLNDDGVIGAGTIAALTVPLDRRVRQLELALERLRWLPPDVDGPVVVVNVPMFRLWAWNSLISPDPPALTMRVVVGGAARHRTPLIASRFRHVVFRPYWNVPDSIVANAREARREPRLHTGRRPRGARPMGSRRRPGLV